MEDYKPTSEEEAKFREDFKIIKERFGIDDDYELTSEEMGLYFAVTRERIKQIDEKILTKKFPGYDEYKKKCERLTKEQGYEPTDEQIAQSLGWPLERVISLKKDVEDSNSRLDDPLSGPNSFEPFPDKMPPIFQKSLRELGNKG